MDRSRRLDLAHLRSFIVLAELLHFGRAAAALHIAQPALSQQIRRLENELGFSLFNRTSRRVALTPAGESFLLHAHTVFTEMDRAVDNARQIASGGAGTITVGYVAVAMLTLLPMLLRRFRERYPEVRVQLREMATDPQLEALHRGNIDVAIVSGFSGDAAIAANEIARDALVALVPSGHAAATKRFVSASILRSDPFIMFPRAQTPKLHDHIIGICRKAGFEPLLGQEAQSWHAIAELVGAGMGISIAPASVERYRIPNVRCIPIRPVTHVSVSICCSRENRSKLVEHFVSAAKSSETKRL